MLLNLFFSFQVIVQNYNSVLTLAHLYQLSDAILVHENDTVHRVCSQLLNIKHISFSDVNRVIAHQLGSVLQPALTADSHGVYSRNPLGERWPRHTHVHTHTRFTTGYEFPGTGLGDVWSKQGKI